jgi:hypothetical protein
METSLEVASKPAKVKPDIRQIRIRPETWARIQQAADKLDQTPSAMVRRLVIEGLNKLENIA